MSFHRNLSSILTLLCLIFSGTARGFSVGTQNLWHYMTDYDRRISNLKKEVQEDGIPDILSSQEAARWGSQSIYDPLIQLVQFKGFYQKTNNFGVMNEGLALDSRLPGSKFESLALPGTSTFSSQYLVAGIFQTEMGPVGVISTHFSPGGNQTTQLRQAQFVIKYIKSKFSNIPTIILGDLNQYPDSDAIKAFIAEGFTDALDWSVKTYVPKENPYNDSANGPERLDYVLYRPRQLKLVKSSLMFNKNIISDHYGIKAEFTSP